MDNFETAIAHLTIKVIEPDNVYPTYVLKQKPRVVTINILKPETIIDPKDAPYNKAEARQLLVKTPDGIFTKKEAALKYGIDASTLINRCKGRTKKHKDTWSFIEPESF